MGRWLCWRVLGQRPHGQGNGHHRKGQKPIPRGGVVFFSHVSRCLADSGSLLTPKPILKFNPDVVF
jgi:hypothetical protein